MGLAEPRKRLKISHDPNNLAWSQSAESYGQKLLSSQGWKPGQGLGARNAKHLDSSPVPKLGISYKDDTLGLGASLKSQDPVQTRTGLDAFQGLLGRLNGKNDVELKKEVQYIENRKLAMWAQGRWGGVMFVHGGTLVQGDGHKAAEAEKQRDSELPKASELKIKDAEETDRAQRKAEKKRRKEQRRITRESRPGGTKIILDSQCPKPETETTDPKDGLLRVQLSGDKVSAKKKEKKKRERPAVQADRNSCPSAVEEGVPSSAPSTLVPSEPPSITTMSTTLPRTGRHLIRGRNIDAKKMAFSDLKMLDQIFMVGS